MVSSLNRFRLIAISENMCRHSARRQLLRSTQYAADNARTNQSRSSCCTNGSKMSCKTFSSRRLAAHLSETVIGSDPLNLSLWCPEVCKWKSYVDETFSSSKCAAESRTHTRRRVTWPKTVHKATPKRNLLFYRYYMFIVFMMFLLMPHNQNNF